jgi:hypothetical protein
MYCAHGITDFFLQSIGPATHGDDHPVNNMDDAIGDGDVRDQDLGGRVGPLDVDAGRLFVR